jgi:hypothetical protein
MASPTTNIEFAVCGQVTKGTRLQAFKTTYEERAPHIHFEESALPSDVNVLFNAGGKDKDGLFKAGEKEAYLAMTPIGQAALDLMNKGKAS